MREFKWTPATCRGLKEKLKRYVEVANLYDHYLTQKGLWNDLDRFEQYVQPALNDVYAYVESLGFTREEAEVCFPLFYEPPTTKLSFEKYARNLSCIIYQGETNE